MAWNTIDWPFNNENAIHAFICGPKSMMSASKLEIEGTPLECSVENYAGDWMADDRVVDSSFHLVSSHHTKELYMY
jgi:hypothetical protein